MEALEFVLPEPPSPFGEIRRFSADGTVVVQGTRASVYVGGTLIGVYDEDDDDRGPRNVLLVTLAKTGEFRIGRLAAAFGMTSEHLRRLRRAEEESGLGAVIVPRQGKSGKVTPEARAAWFAMFDAGQMPADAHRAQPKQDRRAYSTVWAVWEQWRSHRATREAAARSRSTDASVPLVGAESQLGLWSPTEDREDPASPPTSDEGEEIVPMTAQPVRGGRLVQHAGCWILLALVSELGLYEEAQGAFEGRHPDGLRIALDAVICALAIRQLVVEGVRRLATPSGATLLRAERVPSASGVRKLLYRLLDQTNGGRALERQMTERLLRAAKQDGPAVFYVDNHLRPYTGKHTILKGWRMQDKCVLPGTSDYYVHDEDGRPVFRVAVPQHDSLTAWLPLLAGRIREALGDDEHIVLAFDRAGAHAELLAAMRDARFDFVTYERAPYPLLPTTVFTPITIAGDNVGLHEDRKCNLGAGRGRIRRIAVLTQDGRQVNFLANSTLPPERLVEILWNRWRQENGFKHGVERWGINNLDGRGVDLYPPGTIIPNPKRRRLDRALRLARVAEGDARRELARFTSKEDPRHIAADEHLAASLALQEEILDVRPFLPPHMPIEDTELADRLVKHDGNLKSVIDVIRVACANAESELAATLAPHMTRPREAKKLLANLFAAPGTIVVTDHAVHVRLAPAANKAELAAIKHLFAALNQRNLILPSDRKRIPLRFDLARSKP